MILKKPPASDLLIYDSSFRIDIALRTEERTRNLQMKVLAEMEILTNEYGDLLYSESMGSRPDVSAHYVFDGGIIGAPV